MKLHFIGALFLTLILGNNVMADKMIVDDMKNQSGIPDEEFCESGNAKWCFVTDKVMGGVSEGSLEFIKEDNTYFYRMTGELSLENNGGFIQFRTKLENHPADKSFSGVRIRVRGNDNEYSIHIRTKYLLLPWQYYESSFKATNQWTTIELPFSSFNKSNFYQPSAVSSRDIKTIGIVAIGREFDAEIDLASIELY
ncbi:MAG: CIA30 family protein [Gammaproteobacteria bacterium]